MRPILYTIVLFLFLLNFGTVASAQTSPLVYPYAHQNLWGLVDQDRNTILEPSLDSIGLFYVVNAEAIHPVQALAIENDKCGIVNTDGDWILKPKADSIGRSHYYAKGMVWVKRKGKYGLMNFNGPKAKWSIKPRFTQVSDFRGRKLGLAVVAIDDRWGVVNSQGEFVVKCTYDEVELQNTYADYPDIKLTQGEQVSYIGARGEARKAEDMLWDDEIVFEDSIIEDDSYEEERIEHRITKETLAGGRLRISLELSTGGRPYEQVEQRTIGTGYTIYNVVVNEDVRPPRIKHILVQKDGKMGFWGEEGLVAPGAIYDRVITSRVGRHGELAVLFRDGKKGYARVNGDPIVPAVFSTVESFGSLFVLTHPDGYRGYADSRGRIFLPKEVSLEE